MLTKSFTGFKKFLIEHNGTVVIIAATFIFISWLITSTLEKDYKELESKVSVISSEIRLLNYLSQNEMELNELQRHLHSLSSQTQMNQQVLVSRIEKNKIQKPTQKTVSYVDPVTNETVVRTCEIDPKNDFLPRTNYMRGMISALLRWKNTLTIKAKVVEEMKSQIETISQLSVITLELSNSLKKFDEILSSLSAENQRYVTDSSTLFGGSRPCSVDRVTYQKYTDIHKTFSKRIKKLRLEFQQESINSDRLNSKILLELKFYKAAIKNKADRAYYVSLFVYILGTLFAIFGKWGEEKSKLESRT